MNPIKYNSALDSVFEVLQKQAKLANAPVDPTANNKARSIHNEFEALKKSIKVAQKSQTVPSKLTNKSITRTYDVNSLKPCSKL